MACLDTTVLIDLARGARSPLHRRAVAALTERLRAGGFLYVPRPAEAEFRVGQFRSNDPAAEEQRIADILGPFPVLELDQAASVQFARFKAHLLRLGRPSGDMDVLIAAIAIVNGQPLLTRNPKHFEDIPDLVVEAY